MMNTPETVVHRLQVSHGNEMCVGELTFTPRLDKWTFAYDDTWIEKRAFQLSPAIPWQAPEGGYDSNAIRRFIVNLFPEGAPLHAVIEQLHVAPSNAFALLRSMGGETTGALEFHAAEQQPSERAKSRDLPRAELNARILNATEGGLTIWDGKLRMSIAGYQDKLAVFAAHDPGLDPDAAMWLAEPPLASTYILKPQPQTDRTPHLVANEHYCMSLAASYTSTVARVSIMRLPTPVLVIERFDRLHTAKENQIEVRKLHIIDACQACDMPVDAKYERTLGNAGDLAMFRDGMSLPKLFATERLTHHPARTRLDMLRWVLFQLVIGNADAHGKNFSFFVRGELLDPAPWYDLVSVEQYSMLDHTYAMAVGDAFTWDEVTPFNLAYFAHQCRIDTALLRREAARLERTMSKARSVLDKQPYTEEERDFLLPLCEMVQARSQALVERTKAAGTFTAEHF
ncbi:HipA domain-containing protein [Variovorax guangxiensis]|uniref:Serine/threonine-protein kinase HipA n=1 Tax=Variovorax guangxiensis TaxID=1775474 RepID=A0A840FSL9_9BURK|nr:HipA domain-containing protein [Variovorax guangxiensis]MBB4225616.1 serine/threonine-protein kinase HipA [Variovorax guangxiensis]